MRTPLILTVVLAFFAACTSPSEQPPTTDAGVTADTTDANTTALGAAPGFTLTDTNGQQHALSDFAGQWVVLEWLNYDCPFVAKHYNGGNMQATQQRWRDEGAVWLAIVSNAPGEQGHFPPDEMNARSEQEGSRATAVLMDEAGTVGRSYGARTTPQMVIINPEGQIVYNGAIDDRPSRDAESLEGATNYVNQAMEEALAGQPVSVATTQPYGCSMKYADELEGATAEA
ncbi:thioredoxin family protein [soil metagenome]